MMVMDRNTGRALEGLDALRQSVSDVLETPIGTRPVSRLYGSRIFELIDQTMDESFVVEVYAAAADAIMTWVPDLQLERLEVVEVTESGIFFDVYGTDLLTGRGVYLERV
jgi:uncharacterized protein